MKSLSVIISAYNEEAKLKRTLLSVKGIADEIIVIDNFSTDNTRKIAKSFGAKVFQRPNNQMLNVNKNYGFSKATSEWILNLDADEVITPELADEIVQTIAITSDVNGYWMSRKNIIFGKWIEHGLWWPDKQLRLFKKNFGKFPEIHIHEYLHVDGKVDSLKEPYLHYNYESINQYLHKMISIYTENEVIKLTDNGYIISWFDAVRFPLSDFIKIYFAQHAYKDGLHGLILSLLQAFYSFIVFAKLWEKQGFKNTIISKHDIEYEFSRTKKEFLYWYYTVKINEAHSNMVKLYWRIHRKLL